MKNQNMPKVLVVVERGIAYAYAEPGVRVAIADIDNLKVEHTEEHLAIHPDFAALLRSSGHCYPMSMRAEKNQASMVTLPK